MSGDAIEMPEVLALVRGSRELVVDRCAVGEDADAAVIGSAIVALIEKTPAAEAPAAVGAFVASLRGGSV